MASVTWYLTPISRTSSQSNTWTVDNTQTQEYLVFFGPQQEYDALTQDQKDQYDLVVIDDPETNNNPNGQVGAEELREALINSTAPTPSNNAGYLGTGEINAYGDAQLEDSAAYSTSNNGIESSLTGVLITLEPPTATTITPAGGQGFKGGVGNFDPYYPGSLGPDPVCFVSGTLILTTRGQVPVEDLVAGDEVITPDRGPVPLRLVLSSHLNASMLDQQPNLRPIRIRAGALGLGMPTADLLVSPQHRMLVRSRIAQRMFGTQEVLVAAKQLLQLEGIDIAADLNDFRYYHLVFQQHEVVFANGALSESLFPGPEALRNLHRAARDEILAIFPHLRDAAYDGAVAARLLASGRMARKLAVRHRQNQKPLLN